MAVIADDPHVLFAYAEDFADRLNTHPMFSQTVIDGFSDREISISIPAVSV